MDTLTFDARRLKWPALRSIVFCFSIIAISSMTLLKPAHASGTVSATTLYYGGSNGSGYNCSGMASTGAVQGCEVAVHNKWLTDDLDGLNSNPIILPLTSLSCPSAALTDSGPSSPYADVFKITYYRGAVNAGGFWIPIYYKFCDGPKVDNYHLTAKPICPDHSKQTSTTDTTCTCDDTFMPAGTTCIP